MKAGWKVEALDELCEFQRGLTYAKGDEVDLSDNVVLRATNIDLTTNLLNFNELKYISDKVIVPDSKKVKKDSLMICTASGSKSHLGKVAYIDDDYGFAFGGFMGMITPKDELLAKYLFHLMTSGVYKDFIRKLSDGANINNLKFDDLKRFVVPHPSVCEQRRIVSILDEAFVGIATAKANAEKNLQNARAVFERHLRSIFDQCENGWEVKALGDVFVTATGTTPPKSNPGFYGDFMPLIKPPELCDDQVDSAVDGLSKAGVAVARVLPTKSVLISCIGNLGKIGMNTIPVAINQQINAILPEESQALPEFMFFQALSTSFKEQLESLAAGTTVRIVNKSKFNSVSVVLPPLGIQQRVVLQLTLLRQETQHLESIYHRKLASLEELKQSLLHQAFSGAL